MIDFPTQIFASLALAIGLFLCLAQLGGSGLIVSVMCYTAIFLAGFIAALPVVLSAARRNGLF